MTLELKYSSNQNQKQKVPIKSYKPTPSQLIESLKHLQEENKILPSIDIKSRKVIIDYIFDNGNKLSISKKAQYLAVCIFDQATKNEDRINLFLYAITSLIISCKID